MEKKIDLMIVGAQKAGTTSLLRYLGEHPSCKSHPQIEFAYFLNNIDYDQQYSKAFEKYYALQDVTADSIVIAKSASLFTQEIAIKRLYEHNPNCQLVMVLRKPADRTYSSYLMEKNAGSFHFKFDEITEILSRKSSLEYNLLIDYSLYAKHLKTIYKYFPTERVTIILFEDLKENPKAVCEKLFAKLQIATDFVPAVEIKHNITRPNRSLTYARTVNKVLQSNSSFRKFVSHIVPTYKFYKFGNFIRNINKTTNTYAPMSEATKKALSQFFKPHNVELSELTHTNLSRWEDAEVSPESGVHKSSPQYTFFNVDFCNMCGESSSSQKILGKRLNRSQGKNPKNKTGISTTIVQCQNCGLIFSNPLPVPLDIQMHYGVPPESYWQSEYFQTNPESFKGEIDHLRRLLPFADGQKALDIGAGLGKTMIALNKAGYETFGIEPSVPFYERAISKMKIEPDHLSLGMIEHASYPDNHFDFITFGAVLEHLYAPSDAIKTAIKWLKPGGIIHIEVPSSNWLIHKIVNFYYKRFRFSDYVGNLSPMHPPYHLYEFTIKSFKQNSLMHGYQIVGHDYYVCETYLPKFLDFLLKSIMKRRKSGMQLCVWLKKT